MLVLVHHAGGRAGGEGLVVTGEGFGRLAVVFETPADDQERPGAEMTNGVKSVAHQHDRRATVPELLHSAEALGLEGAVAHGQHLVDEQRSGVDVDGHGEPEPHEHPRRIELHRSVDEVVELGEGDDVVEALADLFVGQPQKHAVEKDVLAARHLPLEPDADTDEGRDRSPHRDMALGRAGHACQQPEQGRLPGPVPSQHADRLTLAHAEAHVPEGPEVGLLRPGEGQDRAQQDRLLLQLRVPLADAVDDDGVARLHSRSTKRRS